jgi:NADH-quinone oxidoreductase subunit C
MLAELKKINELSNIKDKEIFYEGEFIKEDAVRLFGQLKNNEIYNFDQLIDITAVDYPSREKRFELIYILLSMKRNKRIILKTFISENENLDSIFDIFKSSNWYERECYDLFGINFNNHPDLRRIMTDYNFEGHPLRKDFPLTGHTEVRYDDVEKKVVYEPVKLTQEYRDFDYTSPWEGMNNGIDDLTGEDKA